MSDRVASRILWAICVATVIGGTVLVLRYDEEPRPVKLAEQLEWTVIKSSRTGRCYEVAYRKQDNIGTTAMMAEIPCN